MKCFILAVLCLTVVSEASAQPVTKTMLRLPDTGQQSSYTATYGEDSDFLINMPGFVDNSDGTVTDTVTGLMWQKTDGPEMTYSTALHYVDTLFLAGYSDWRLPNAKEIYSILNHQRSNPAIDLNVFSATIAEYWWTSDRQVNDTSRIWCANAGGGIGNHRMSETISAGGTKRFQVRTVRANTAPLLITNRYTDLTDGTIVDSLSGLQWTKLSSSDSITWEQALLFADTMSTAGYSDWRLPNIKELQSLNNELLQDPSLPTNYFSNSTSEKYWSSTSLPNQTAKAWYLDSRFGITTYDDKVLRHYVLCVRTYDLIPTAVSEIDASGTSFGFFPNPFTDHVSVKGNTSDTQWDFFDLQGRQVLDKVFLTEAPAKLIPGSYFVRKSAGDGMTYRLVKD